MRAARSAQSLERMKLDTVAVFTAVVVSLAGCGERHDAVGASPAEDQAVISVVLEDFAHWQEATFGDLEGILELDPHTRAEPDWTVNTVRSLADEHADKVSDKLATAFLTRNRAACPVAELVGNSRWARVRAPDQEYSPIRNLPPGVKAAVR